MPDCGWLAYPLVHLPSHSPTHPATVSHPFLLTHSLTHAPTHSFAVALVLSPSLTLTSCSHCTQFFAYQLTITPTVTCTFMEANLYALNTSATSPSIAQRQDLHAKPQRAKFHYRFPGYQSLRLPTSSVNECKRSGCQVPGCTLSDAPGHTMQCHWQGARPNARPGATSLFPIVL